MCIANLFVSKTFSSLPACSLVFTLDFQERDRYLKVVS